MNLEKFDYDLPKEKIAFYPPEKRGGTKLLVIDRKTKEISHMSYSDIPQFMKKGDTAVLNNTKVDKVRLFFIDSHRNSHEVLFLPTTSGEYRCLINGSKELKKGDQLLLEDDRKIGLQLIEKDQLEPIWEVYLLNIDLETLSSEYGHVPLPPYIRREDVESDYERYNTTFAKEAGSSASPTASLNLTEDLLGKIKGKGISINEVTLDIGWGTFAPIRTDEIEKHPIHSETFSISKNVADSINETINGDRELWVFGTTVTRVLESVAKGEPEKGYTIEEKMGETDLYIYPGYEWKVVDHLITNFHAPRTSLLTLVASFMGYNLMMKAYQEALESDYMFLSYGDSMLII